MEYFKFVYLNACQDLRAVPNEKILSRISDAGSKTSLNLSGIELNDETCRAISLALLKDVHVRELDFSNCYLPQDGLLNILRGLEENKFLLNLNLRGNNIKSSGAVAIGKLLRHNNHLQKLCLEWNGLGIFPEKFAILCEGLCVNSSLKFLDLRNNNLNYVCAQSLADVISRNISLQNLDLRWNNIGLIGGRAILKALSKNKTLLSIDISGNEIPSEIVDSVEIATAIASERFLTNNQHIEKTKILISKLQDLEHGKNLQLKTLMDQLERKEKEASENQRWSTMKLSQLQEVLSQKDSTLEDLTLQLHDSQKKISDLTTERNNSATKLKEMEMSYQELHAQHLLDLKKEKQDKEAMEQKLLGDIGVLREETLFLKQHVQDHKNLITHLEDQNLKLKGTVSKLEKMAKLDQSSFEEQLSSLCERHSEALRENEIMRKSEVARVRSELFDVEASLQKKIVLLESQKADLEQECLKKKSQFASEKADLEEKLNNLEKLKKIDEENLRLQMEEKIEIIENSKRKLEKLLQENLQSMYEIRKKASSLDIELAESAHKNLCLQQLLESKDAEIEACVIKAKLEVKDQLEELTGTKKLLQKAYKEIDSLKDTIKDLESKHEEELKLKNETIQNLSNEIEKQKKTIKEMIEEENERNLQLKMAFASYLNPSKQTAGLDLLGSGDTVH